MKTDGKSTDRLEIDAAVEPVAMEIAGRVTSNLSLIREYGRTFEKIIDTLLLLSIGDWGEDADAATSLAKVIYSVGARYHYEGAYLGELNYGITRFIQRVPQIKVARNEWQDEIRYWAYGGGTVGPLLAASAYALDGGWHNEHNVAIAGVFMDIKDEYKWKVNRSYEAAQIRKSGDAYDTPFRCILVEMVSADGAHVGYQDVYVVRKPGSPMEDVLTGRIVLT